MQDIKGKIKVAAAAAAGTLMLGATMAGAMAADLGNLPDPFVVDNEFVGQIVVGANAIVPDVIAAAQVSAAFGEYLVSASASGSASTATDYKQEDIALNAVVATGLGKTAYTDTDISKLLDTEISFRGETYDIHEEIVLGGSDPALVTGVDTSTMSGVQDGDTYGSDVGAKVYMTGAEGAIKYQYKFDDTLNGTELITSSYPLELTILGQELKVTDVAAGSDKITVQLGTAAILGEGGTTTVEGYTVSVDTIGSTSVALSVSGSGCSDSDFASETDTWEPTCSDLKIYVEDILYVDAGSASNKVKLRVGEDTTKSYSDGDAYIGEDDDDPTWVWDIDETAGVISYIGVEYKPDVNSLDDNPITIGGEIALPNDYVVLKLDSYNTETRGEFTFKFDSSEDIYETGASSTPITALDNKPVFYVIGPADDAFSDGTNEAQKIVFSQLDDGAWWTFIVAYWDEDNNKWVNDTRLFNTTATGMPEADTGWNLVYQDASYDIKVSGVGDDFRVSLIAGSLDNITIALHDAATGFDYLGSTDNSADVGELVIGTSNVGTVKSGILTHYGSVIGNPDSNGDSDKVVIEVPDEQVKAYVYLGAPTTGTTTTTTGVTYTYTGLNAEVAVLDSEADTTGSTPLIVVGGPYANAVAKTLIGTDDTAIEEFFGYDATAGTGKGIVKMYDASDSSLNVEAMVVAGWAAKDTRAAAYVLGQYLTGVNAMSGLSGKSTITVTATSATSISSKELA